MKRKEADQLDLLVDISELADLVTGSADLESFLQLAVDLVAGHFNAPVCSIYLYHERSNRLVLKATKGLRPEAVETVRMKPGEGLVGQSFQTLSVIREGNARKNPGFKYFKAAGEDPYNSFLCVPIKRGVEKIGVLVVQHSKKDYFDASDDRAIRAVVIQLAGAIENARLLLELSQEKNGKEKTDFPPFIRGTALTPGYALGHAMVHTSRGHSLLYASPEPMAEMGKPEFQKALEKTSEQLKALQKEFARRLPESASLIFTAHFMILKDKHFSGSMETLIDQGEPPDSAVRKIAGKYIKVFSSSPHAYMQEKAQDVEDLSVRILGNLAADPGGDRFGTNAIVIADQAYPSDILKFVSAGIKGIILAGGGAATSHVTILARSLQVPLIITDDQGLLSLPDSTTMLMDGQQGNIYINPDADTVALFERKMAAEKKADAVTMQPRTLTHDKKPVTLLANINLLSEAALARRMKAEGIGLYRTEFPFLIRATFPSEDEQYVIYKKLFDQIGNLPLTFRTLDAGGEKTLAYSDSPTEDNPELGLRSIRFSLKHRDIFEHQIRAILRASADRRHTRIMFPLVSSMDEFIEARQVVNKCMDMLSDEGLAFNPDVAVGLMVELPSVLETIDEFAREADFFSIGTNDFVQYMLAADRANKMVADHYVPCHPAVNRGIAKIAAAAIRHGIDVSVCGEMAHEPQYISFLLGVGIRSLSVDPQFLPGVQETISGISMAAAEKMAENLLAQSSIKGARQVLDDWAAQAVRPA